MRDRAREEDEARAKERTNGLYFNNVLKDIVTSVCMLTKGLLREMYTSKEVMPIIIPNVYCMVLNVNLMYIYIYIHIELCSNMYGEQWTDQ